MSFRAIPRLNIKKTLLFVCDMQEKFALKVNGVPPQRNEYEGHVYCSNCKASDRYCKNTGNVPIIVTEQYPQRLGSTVKELGLEDSIPRYAKTQFSMCVPEVEPLLKDKESAIIVGLEAHVCILHTTYGLLEKGLNVHVVADAVTARTMVDRKFAFKQLERAGAVVTTSECVILSLLKDAKHPKFKEVQKLIMTEAPDSGLLDM